MTRTTDLSSALKLRTLRGQPSLRPREIAGLLRGELTLQPDPDFEQIGMLLQFACLAQDACQPWNPQALTSLARQMKGLSNFADWLNFTDVPEYLPPSNWKAAARLTVCAWATLTCSREEPGAQTIPLTRQWTQLLAELIPPHLAAILSELGLTPDETDLISRMAWPVLRDDSLIFAEPPPSGAQGRSRRWQQALYPAGELHLLNVTLHAQRPGNDTPAWPTRETSVPSELACLMDELLALQAGLPELTGSPDTFTASLHHAAHLILPPLNPAARRTGLGLTTLLMLARLPHLETGLAATMSQELDEPQQELDELRRTLTLLLEGMRGHPEQARFAALEALWPSLERAAR